MDGILIVDKDEGKTSFDVIRDVRKKYNEKKVGHIGTLDPLASGVLPILMGKATKLSDYLMEHSKEYIAKIKLGELTETGDREGKIIKTQDVPKDINSEKIKNILNEFLGKTYQTPPMYSALKIDGKKLYELARSGQEIERKPRKIEITDIDLINYDSIKNEISYKVSCSKGTYIRVLSEDIAKKLGTLGYMTYLRRTRVGNFTLADSGRFIPIGNVFKNNSKIIIKSQDELRKFLNGVRIKVNNNLLKIDDDLPKNNFSEKMNLHNEKYINIEKNEDNNTKNNFYETINLHNVYYNEKFIGICKEDDESIKRFIVLIDN